MQPKGLTQLETHLKISQDGSPNQTPTQKCIQNIDLIRNLYKNAAKMAHPIRDPWKMQPEWFTQFKTHTKKTQNCLPD